MLDRFKRNDDQGATAVADRPAVHTGTGRRPPTRASACTPCARASARSSAESTGAPPSSAGWWPSDWARCSSGCSPPRAPRSASPTCPPATASAIRGRSASEERSRCSARSRSSYFGGGYVAGRMSRFDGARQGIGAWLIGLVVTVVLAAAGALLGAEYNVLEQLNLPALPVGDAELATGGAMALAIVARRHAVGRDGRRQGRRALPPQGRSRRVRRLTVESRPAVSGIRRRRVGDRRDWRASADSENIGGGPAARGGSGARRSAEREPPGGGRARAGRAHPPAGGGAVGRHAPVRRQRRSRRPAGARRRALARARRRRPRQRRAARPGRPRAAVAGLAARAGLLPVQAVWSVLSSVTLAVLDRRFAAEAARYPEITAALFDRLGERSLRLATTQAISQLTRVDRRLKALFWHLAERWGRVSGDGVVVPLALTHRILGQLVGARRPTVSTALSELAEREELVRRPDGSWLLRGDPPDAQTLARRPTAAELRGQDVLRPSRRFAREGEDVRPRSLIAAMDRLREALEPALSAVVMRVATVPIPRLQGESPTWPGSLELRGHPVRRQDRASARSSSRCSRRRTGWRSRR